jgi:N-hydroxyarylamine O-acetyltransferase
MLEVVLMPDEREHTISAVPIDLDAYLTRIGYKGAIAATRETLEGLHFAHATTIPFENLDILFGRPISLDLEHLQAKLVASRRGGYCFEHNTLFAAVLESLGFKVTRLAARVRFGTLAVRPRTHMLLSVEVDGEPFLADVGFGCRGPLHPIRMHQTEPVRQLAWAFQIRSDGDVHVVQSHETEGWLDLYSFTLERQYPIDYEVANYYTAAHPNSPFVHTLLVQRQSAQARWTLRNRELTEQKPGEVTTETVWDDAALLDVLAELFDLQFPAGTHFRFRPDGPTGHDQGTPVR